MLYQYLVTTRFERLPTNCQIIMVDGTVPGWKPSNNDLHFDHHRPGGADIQIDEIDPNVRHKILPNACFVTTQVDADACAAAAYLQIDLSVCKSSIDKLRAIAYDCDHLAVPPALSKYAEFAACAVATLKLRSDDLLRVMNLPNDRKLWSIDQKERFASEAFKYGTQWLVDAVEDRRYWPGEMGEAAEYWERVERDVDLIITEKRISMYRNCLLFDEKGLGGRYVDPRSFLVAAQRIGVKSGPITLTQKEVFVNNALRGYSYTLGCIPFHPVLAELDYTAGVFSALTGKERELNPQAEGWGGRRTVGGSGWNTVSLLTPKQVINIVLEVNPYLPGQK